MFKKNFTKIDIIKNLSNQSGYPKSFSKKVLGDLINIIIDQIKTGNLNLKNLGTFKIIFKNERTGRNPKTKEKFIISARKSIRFVLSEKISKSLKNRT